VRIALIVTGGVDRSGREHVTPTLLWLIERLARMHELHVFALHYYRDPCSYPLLGATVHDVGRVEGPRGLRRVRLRARLTRALAAVGSFDVLHAYMGMPGIIVAPIAKRLGGPLVLTLDSGELVAIDDIAYGLQRRPVDRRSLNKALRIAAAVTVTTEFMARQPALDGVDASVVPIGIDAHLFPMAARADGPPWRLLRVGSLNRVKDYPTLLHALRRIVDRGVDVHLDVVGEDTMDGAIQALAASLNLLPRITFHGVQRSDQLAPFYARAHLHVVSSRHEAASVAVLEAAAAGLPTVGTRVGYVADWAPERADAVPVGDAEALATAVIALLQDPARRARLAERARSWTLSHDADWTAARFAELYAAAATR
jgi:glycosyltransferase involved in cell wall biosynthesis